MIEKGFKWRVIYSSAWVTGGFVFSQILRLLSNLILTRLLVPEMFGIMAIVSAFMTSIVMFSDVGLLQNIVQSKRGEDRIFLDTAWTIQIIKGFVIFIFAFIISLFIYFIGDKGWFPSQSAYADPNLPFLLLLSSFSALVGGFNSINLMVFNRKLMIGKVVFIGIISQLIGLILMIVLAWYWREVWVLLIGGIISSLAKMILSHHSTFGERCRFRFDTDCIKEIVGFGKWIFVSSIFGFMLAQGDKFILGIWVTPDILGMYTIASFLANALKSTINKLIGSVFYPLLSEVSREEPRELKRVYYKIRAKVDFITMFSAGFFVNAGDVLIKFLYDERYVESGWMFELLSVSMLLVGYSLAGTCLMAKGGAKKNAILTFFPMLFLYLCLPVVYTLYGLWAAILVIAINSIINIPFSFYMMHKSGLLSIWNEFRMVPVAIIAYFISNYIFY